MSGNGDERYERPDPEVVPMAERRRFRAGEKLRILEEAEACTEAGEIGSLLRREGIYSSYLSRWRQARDRPGHSRRLRGTPSAAAIAINDDANNCHKANGRAGLRLSRPQRNPYNPNGIGFQLRAPQGEGAPGNPGSDAEHASDLHPVCAAVIVCCKPSYGKDR